MSDNPKLSVVVITFNEADQIDACLQSIKDLADEIVVFDSGSTDDTVAKVRQYTDRVFETDWPGFGPQKQRALQAARGRWVLSLDADERVSPELVQEIRAVMQQDIAGAYIPRLTSVCGQPVRHGGWYPDYLLRLVQREYAFFSEDVVHEQLCLQPNAPGLANGLPRLKTPILHPSYTSLDQLVQKMNLYSSMGAEKLAQKGIKGGVTKALIKGFAAFCRSYIFKRGFLDGSLGVVIAISSAESAYYKYLKRSFLLNERGAEDV